MVVELVPKFHRWLSPSFSLENCQNLLLWESGQHFLKLFVFNGVCVCRSCLASRDPYCGWTRGSTCSFLRPGTRWGKHTRRQIAASESFLPLQSAALSKLRTSHCIQRKFNLMRLQHLCMERCGSQDDVELVYSYSLRKISGNKCSCSLRDKD